MRKTTCFCLALLAVGAIGAGAPVQEFRLPGEPPPPYLIEWGTSGTGNGQFDNNIDVAVDAAGNVYVADRWNSRIQKFDSSGAFLTTWGTSGPGDGEFGGTDAIAVDASGNVYVADGFDRIQKFDSNGAFLAKWGAWGLGEGSFWGLSGVAVDSAGSVYVVEEENHRVQKFDGGGTFERMWGFGVQDGAGVLQICTSGCRRGLAGGGAGDRSGKGRLQRPPTARGLRWCGLRPAGIDGSDSGRQVSLSGAGRTRPDLTGIVPCTRKCTPI